VSINVCITAHLAFVDPIHFSRDLDRLKMAAKGYGMGLQAVIQSISVDSLHFDWSGMSGTTTAALVLAASLLITVLLLLCVPVPDDEEREKRQ
jgi:hypothetical protein